MPSEVSDKIRAHMSLLRTLLLCFLTLALPFQGLAAAAMAACALPKAATAHAGAEAQHHGNAHQHAQHSAGMHDAAQHMHGEPAADQQHAGSHDLQADNPNGDHKCNACSVCHASAVVDTHVAIQAHTLPDGSPAMHPRAMASLVPSLPDKPPRA